MIRHAAKRGYGDCGSTSSGGDAVSVHRICVQADRGGDPIAVDVALPSGAPIGELLPAILDLVDDRPALAGTARGWRLDRPAGGALLDSLSLTDNGVHDGELLILAPEQAPPLGPMRLEPCREVAATRLPAHGMGGSLTGVVCMLAAVVAAVALAWSGVGTHAPANLIVAVIGACAAAVVALASRHPAALGVAAAALAAATGFLAVPSGPAAPNVLLAAAAAFAASLLVLRLSGQPSAALTGVAAFSVPLAVANVTTMPFVVVGAVLAVASLGLLALAPRLTVLATGLGPEHWVGEVQVRATAGHATLTGLVGGCAAGTASGAALVAFAGLRVGASLHGAVAFAALAGLVLLLRARTHVEPARQTLLATAGLISCTASFATTVITYPNQAGWAGGVLVAVALLAGRRPRIGTVASRFVDRLEYAALAAVVPVALWVGGAYAFVGEVHLP